MSDLRPLFLRHGDRSLLRKRVGVAFLMALFVAAPSIAQDPVEKTIQQGPASYLVGSASCASSACHAKPNPLGADTSTVLREYATWIDKDPHAMRAKLTLASETFDAIVKKVAQLQRSDDTARARQSCLPCHSPMSLAESYHTGSSNASPLEQGIGCESCHGPASQWLNRHFDSRLSVEEKQTLGMKPTSQLKARAQACAECHVGSPNASVTHDMYAAGHPPMRFEFASYHTRLPKHWRAANERRRIAEFESELWLAGQLAGAQSELAQWLATTKRKPNAPSSIEKPAAIVKPRELANFDCYACHRQISLSPTRWSTVSRSASDLREALAAPRWRTWNMAFLFDGLAPAPNDIDRDRFLRALASQDVDQDKAAHQAVIRLGEQITGESVPHTPTTDNQPDSQPNSRTAVVIDCLEKMLSRMEASGSLNWDEACQLYLGLTSLDRSVRDSAAVKQAEDAANKLKLASKQREAIREALRFTPDDAEKPRLWATSQVDEASVVKAMRECLENYRSLLATKGTEK